MPEAVLFDAWSSTEAAASPGACDELRVQLCELSLAEPELCAWLAEAWRRAQAELIAATERLAIEELAASAGELLRRFDARELLLAVLTETDEDTAENVELLLAALPAGRPRARLSSEWFQLQPSRPPDLAGRPTRLALVGGHPSEGERLRVLEARLGLQFDWIPADKGKGLGPTHSALADLTEARAILVVTGNVSHSTMHCAKRAAERLEVPCGYLERLTERQLVSCLAGLPLEELG